MAEVFKCNSDWLCYNNTTTSITDRIDKLKEELMEKKVLFIAPSRKYAETVVRNLQKDLTRQGVTSNVKVESHTLWVFTAAVIIKLNWWDPVAWNMGDFKDYHALFGKKELVELARDRFNIYHFNCPKQALYKWVVEQHYTGERDVPAPRTRYIPEIKKVHCNYPATIVIWEDGTKTIVKCQEGDFYSPETGLALCIAKKALGNKSNFNNVFKKYIPEMYEEQVDNAFRKFSDIFERIIGKEED